MHIADQFNRVLATFFVNLREKIVTVPISNIFVDQELKYQIDCNTNYGLKCFDQFREFLENF